MRDSQRDRRAAVPSAFGAAQSAFSISTRACSWRKWWALHKECRKPGIVAIGLRVIVDNDLGDIHQEAAARGADAIDDQKSGGGDMQPLRSAADPKAGFIHVLDRRRCDMVSHDIGEALEAQAGFPG